MKKALFYFILLVLLYLTLEFFSAVGLWILEKVRGVHYEPLSLSLSPQARATIETLLADEPMYTVYDSLLGWTIKPNGTYSAWGVEFGHSNADGLRADREFEEAPPAGVVRISAFGDSFTHGDEVRTRDTWTALLAQDDPLVEVLNFGVSAYDLGQAFLRYQHDGVQFGSHIVLIGFLSENIFRSVNVFRPFYTKWGPHLAKPRYVLREGDLKLVQNPLPSLSDYRRLLEHEGTILRRLGEHDYFFHTTYMESPFDFLPSVRLVKLTAHMMQKHYSQNQIVLKGKYNTRSEAFAVTLRTLEEFYRLAKTEGSSPVILLFPTHNDVLRFRNHRPKSYAPLAELLRQRNFRCIDLMEAFDSFGLTDVEAFFGRYHYSPLGNRIVAEWIRSYLKEHTLVSGN